MVTCIWRFKIIYSKQEPHEYFPRYVYKRVMYINSVPCVVLITKGHENRSIFMASGVLPLFAPKTCLWMLRYLNILFMYIKCVFYCLKIHWHLVCWIFDSHVNSMLLYIYLVGGEHEYSRSEWRWALIFLCVSFVIYINGTDKLYLCIIWGMYMNSLCIYNVVSFA